MSRPTPEQLNTVQAAIAAVLLCYEDREADLFAHLDSLPDPARWPTIMSIIGIAAGMVNELCESYDMDTSQYLVDAIYAADPSNSEETS